MLTRELVRVMDKYSPAGATQGPVVATGGAAFKGEIWLPLLMTFNNGNGFQNNTPGEAVVFFFEAQWTPANWPTSGVSWIMEVIAVQYSSGTAVVRLYNGGAVVAQVTTVGIGTIKRYRTGPLTMPTSATTFSMTLGNTTTASGFSCLFTVKLIATYT